MGAMRRGKTFKRSLVGFEHKQCMFCSKFYDGPWTDYAPGQIIGAPHRISHGICGADCEQRNIRRMHHDRSNDKLQEAGHEPVPRPDELSFPWELSGQPRDAAPGWQPPEGLPREEGSETDAEQ